MKILLLEDNVGDAELNKYLLREGGLNFLLERVQTKADFTQYLEKSRPDLILADHTLPGGFDGMQALEIAQSKWPEVPFIFVAGTLGEELAIGSLKRGATDYVLKSRMSRLVPAVHRALREAAERVERNRAEEKLRAFNDQLRAVTVYLEHAREEERSGIAREIQNEIGQTLSRLRLDVSWLVGRFPEALSQHIAKVTEMAVQIDTAAQAVNRIVTDLRPSVLDDLGLVAALEFYAAEFQIRSGIRCAVTSAVEEPVLDNGFKHLHTAFFRTFQEILAETMRHSGASRIEARLSKVNNTVVLEVKDDGCGIAQTQISGAKSVGMLEMQERARRLGGEVTFHGQKGKGATVTVTIPLRRSHGSDAPAGEAPRRRRSRSE